VAEILYYRHHQTSILMPGTEARSQRDKEMGTYNSKTAPIMMDSLYTVKKAIEEAGGLQRSLNCLNWLECLYYSLT
jgi:hypothetical protein